MTNLQPDLSGKKERGIKSTKLEMKKTTDYAEIQRILKDYYEQLYGNKMDNLEEMDRLLGKFNPPRLPVQVQCKILDAWGWCTGTTQRDGMGREEGGGFRMGSTCIPVMDSF